MQQLRAGKLPQKVVKIFFRNWGSYSIEINTLEAASYYKHIAFFASIEISWARWRRSWPMS